MTHKGSTADKASSPRVTRSGECAQPQRRGACSPLPLYDRVGTGSQHAAAEALILIERPASIRHEVFAAFHDEIEDLCLTDITEGWGVEDERRRKPRATRPTGCSSTWKAGPAPRQADGQEDGFAVYIDEQQVLHADWLTHHRFDSADLDSLVHSDNLFTDVSRRNEAAATAMNSALTSILTALGYHTAPPLLGHGYTILPAPARLPPTDPKRSNPVHHDPTAIDRAKSPLHEADHGIPHPSPTRCASAWRLARPVASVYGSSRTRTRAADRAKSAPRGERRCPVPRSSTGSGRPCRSRRRRPSAAATPGPSPGAGSREPGAGAGEPLVKSYTGEFDAQAAPQLVAPSGR